MSRSEALNWDAVSAWRPKGKRIPFRAQHRDAVSVHSLPPIGISPDKTCQNKPVPFWQVLEADGEGDLMVVAGYSSGASVGLGDSAYDG